MPKSHKETMSDMLATAFYSGSITSSELYLLREQLDLVTLEAKTEAIRELQERANQMLNNFGVSTAKGGN